MTQSASPDRPATDEAARPFSEFQNPYRLLFVSATTVLLVGLLALWYPERVSSALPTALVAVGVATLFCALVVRRLCRAQQQRVSTEPGNLRRLALQTSGALGLCLLALTLLTGRAPTGRNDISATFVPHGLCLFAASLAAGAYLGQRWVARGARHPDEPTRVVFGPGDCASIGRAAGWTLGFGGSFLWQAIMGGTGGQFTGIGEIFVGLLAMGIGSAAGREVAASIAKKRTR
jgi:hypothetical protein